MSEVGIGVFTPVAGRTIKKSRLTLMEFFPFAQVERFHTRIFTLPIFLVVFREKDRTGDRT